MRGLRPSHPPCSPLIGPIFLSTNQRVQQAPVFRSCSAVPDLSIAVQAPFLPLALEQHSVWESGDARVHKCGTGLLDGSVSLRDRVPPRLCYRDERCACSFIVHHFLVRRHRVEYSSHSYPGDRRTWRVARHARGEGEK
jgi:hypothetical protein